MQGGNYEVKTFNCKYEKESIFQISAYIKKVLQGRMSTFTLPAKRGQNLQAVTGPQLEYCPIDSSMKNMGIPTNIAIIK